MRIVAMLVSLLMLTLHAADASAQDERRVGIVMQTGSGIGAIWNATSKVAIRPEFSFSSSETDATPTGFTETSVNGYTVGVSGLLYLHRWAALRAYVSPQYSYGHSTFESEATFSFLGGPSVSSIEIETKTTSHGIAGFFGAQYTLHERFAAFAEVGVGYTRTESSSPFISVSSGFPAAPIVTTNTRQSHGSGTRSAVGAIFYF
jgi:hypothetical protein